jgi:hypothetical protein
MEVVSALQASISAFQGVLSYLSYRIKLSNLGSFKALQESALQMRRTQSSQNSLAQLKNMNILIQTSPAPTSFSYPPTADSNLRLPALGYSFFIFHLCLLSLITIIPQGVKFPKRLRSESPPSEPDRVAELLEWAKARVKPASSAATSVKRKPQPLTKEERSWLTEKAKAMEGFETFQSNTINVSVIWIG